MVAPVMVGGGRQDRHERQAGPQQDPATNVQETTKRAYLREIMMGVGNRVASVIMLTFPSEPRPHADFSK